MEEINVSFFQTAKPLLQRFVPFIAVSAANAVNIPFTRQR